MTMTAKREHKARILVDSWPLAFRVDTVLNVVYPLTSCCQAVARAIGNSRVECTDCGTVVDERFGLGWTIEEAADTLLCPVCTDTHHWCPQSPLHGKGCGDRA